MALGRSRKTISRILREGQQILLRQRVRLFARVLPVLFAALLLEEPCDVVPVRDPLDPPQSVLPHVDLPQ